MVIAGPGSGKTYSVVLRALNLLLLGKALPREIALCTFTEKAAFEMRDRLSAAAQKTGCRGDLSEMVVSTLHSLCNRLLTQHRHRTPLGHNYETLDELTIAESTKEQTEIGRFGIGFKSVYAFTDRPEVHSGEENFVIENFVWPTVASPIEREPEETVFILPLRDDDPTAHREIAQGLQRLGPRTLLFLRQIEEITCWVPDLNGELQQPEFVLFDNLGWKPNPFLLSKIRFKPSIIETLAKAAGIEPGVLDLLKQLGVTTEAELRVRLGIKDESETHNAPEPNDVNEALKKLLGSSVEPTPPGPDPAGLEPIGWGSGRGGAGIRGETASGGRDGTPEDVINSDRTVARTPHLGTGMGQNTPGRSSGRPFVSYVGTHPYDEEPDPDGLDQEARMALEEKAIHLILASQPHLKRTPTHNPGYDLFEGGEDAQPARWMEVKAMTSDLYHRPVALSRAQFICAQEHGEAYWLYVVEYAGDENRARIVHIQNPAGKACTFTFDHGWLAVAELADDNNSALGEEEVS
ncbi:MAG TPA: UvrD-helicase domain-containing protein [Alphaproteobacteria bacterium]|nr:UvrD-helicase domain-containing protein [Alphaproteobacteria bacterium]